MIEAALFALAVVLAMPPAPRFAPAASTPEPVVGRDWMERGRALWSLLAVAAGLTFAPQPLGLPAGVAAGITVWLVSSNAEPAANRWRAAAIGRDLPTLVDLVAASLEAGLDVPGALDLAVAALPGAGADALGPVAARLRLGVPDAQVWATPGAGAALAPLARALARAHESGASVATSARLLADDLSEQRRLEVENRARSVGVRAALPLGLCLLPGFVVLGVVPMVAGAVDSIAW